MTRTRSRTRDLTEALSAEPPTTTRALSAELAEDTSSSKSEKEEEPLEEHVMDTSSAKEKVLVFESFMPTSEMKMPAINFSKMTLPFVEVYKNDLANRICEKKSERLQKSFHKIV